MKFVCDNCQAKYQIGDEKVAGKTVRMKCRRCGYEIRVRADNAEAASTESPIQEMDAPPLHAVPPPPTAIPGARMPGGPPGVGAPRAAAMPRPTMLGGHTAPELMAAASAPAAPAATHRAPATAATAAAAAPVPAPRPVPPAAHSAPRSITPRPVTAAPAPRPAAPVAPAAPRPAASAALSPPAPQAAPSPGVPRAPVRPVTRTSSSSQMAAVRPVEPAPAVDDASAHSGPLHVPPPSDAPEPDYDWYVGIRGTPTGPIRAAEIRERAAAGDVEGDSLVWREGMGEWRALRTVPSLLAIVEAARAPIAATPAPPPRAVPAPAVSVPFSLVQPKPAAPVATPAPIAAAPGVAPAPLAAAPAPAPAPLAAPAPIAPPAPIAAPIAAPAPAAAAPVPVAAAPAPEALPVAPIVVADPFAAPAAPSNGKANGIHVAALAASAPVAAPAPAEAAPAAPEAVATAARTAPARTQAEVEAEADRLEAALGRKRATHPMAYAFIAAAAVFGGVAAWVLLTRPPPQIVVVQAPAPTVVAAAPTTTAEPAQAQVEVGEVSTGTPQGAAPKLGGPLKPKATASATAGNAAPIDTSGFVNNVPGPSQQGPSGSQAGGGGQLSQGEISAVVSQNQPLVKRKCWQPALESRPPNGATNARVNGSLTIGASGAVESASASGAERDFPGLSSCIAGRMKGWKFPASGGSTTVNVPFVFAGQ